MAGLIGEYLLALSEKRQAAQEAARQAGGDSLFPGLTRADKLKLAFKHLDQDGSG